MPMVKRSADPGGDTNSFSYHQWQPLRRQALPLTFVVALLFHELFNPECAVL
jgi:hypothetical protein